MAGTLALAGCQKGIGLNGDPQEKSELTASIEQMPSDNGTKTNLTYNDLVCWSAGDKISVNGTSLTVYPFGMDATSASLSGTATANTSGRKYYGYYPVTSGWWDIGAKSITLPATRTYNPASPLDCVPMYAESDDNHLVFRNLFGLMELSLTGWQYVSSIKLTCTAGDLTGKFLLDGDGKTKLSGTSGKTVTLNCPTGGVGLGSAGTKFYIAIPEGSYTGFRIDVYTVGGGEINKASTASVTIKGGRIYPVAFEAEPKAVRLWDEGPYWATANVGATGPLDPGGLYMWGSCSIIYSDKNTAALNSAKPAAEGYKYTLTWDPSVRFHFKNTPYCVDATAGSEKFSKYVSADNKATMGKDGTFYDNKFELDSEDDCATVNWGPKWKTPSLSEYRDLFSNCFSVWTTISSMTGYVCYKVKKEEDKGIIWYGSTYKKFNRNNTTSDTSVRPSGYSTGTDTYVFLVSSGYIGQSANWNQINAGVIYWTRDNAGNETTGRTAGSQKNSRYGVNINIAGSFGSFPQNCNRLYGFGVRAIRVD